jgi:hypothetical protein
MLTDKEIQQLPILDYEFIDELPILDYDVPVHKLPIVRFDGVKQQCGLCDLYMKADVGAIRVYIPRQENCPLWDRSKFHASTGKVPESVWHIVRFGDYKYTMPLQNDVLMAACETTSWPEMRYHVRRTIDTIPQHVVIGTVLLIKDKPSILMCCYRTRSELTVTVFAAYYCGRERTLMTDLGYRALVFYSNEDEILFNLCADGYKYLRALQRLYRRRQAVRKVDLLRAKPTELFHPVYGEKRQELLQKRDEIKKTW